MNRKNISNSLIIAIIIIAFLPKETSAQITRGQIISNANAYTSYSWTATANNIWKNKNCSGVGNISTPSWVTAGSKTSIPYCWGGWSSLSSFSSGISNGKSAGNNDCTTSGDINGSCSVGVDCSGYITNAWGITSQKYSTSSLVGISRQINLSQIQQGDILNDSGSHTMLVTSVNGNGSVNVLESSSKDWKVSSGTYTPLQLTSYVPRVYNNISGGGTPPSAPVAVSPGSASEPGQTITILAPTFQWNTVSNVTGYKLYISKYPYGSANIIYQNESISGNLTSLTIPANNLSSGNKYRWNMTAYNSYGESSVSNTLYFQTQNTGGQPDLKITAGSQNVNPTSVAPGSNITASCSEDNSGSVVAAGNIVSLYLSQDNVLNESSDILLGSITFPSVSANSCSAIYSKTVQIPNGTAPGNYYLFFWADGGKTVSESDETNNFASVQLVVTANTNTSIIINSTPSGRLFSIEDGSTFTAPHTFSWSAGSSHSIVWGTPQAGGTGIQYPFLNWSDGLVNNPRTIIVPSSGTTYTANFDTQYYLTLSINPSGSGSLNLSNNWYSAGTQMELKATPQNGYSFSGWSGNINSTQNPINITLNSPQNITASFSKINQQSPTIISSSTSNITTSSAHIDAMVNPNGLSTQVYLEFGTTLSYGSSSIPVSAGSGTTNVTVNCGSLTGLQPGTTYHYRVIATSNAGTNRSNDYTFITDLSCQLTLNSHELNIYSTAQSNAFWVYTASGCSWNATTNGCNGMITLTNASGTGNGMVTFDISANTNSSSRTCTISVGDQLFTINQNGYVTPCSSAPSVPTNLQVNVAESNVLYLSWEESNQNVTDFEIERSASASGPFTMIGSSSNDLFYKDRNVVGGTTYYYRVKACCNTNCSNYSNVAGNMACTFSLAATGITASADSISAGSSVTLTVLGGILGTGTTWTWRTSQCNSGQTIGTGTSITVTPNSSNVYFVKPEGGNCGPQVFCVSKSITVKSNLKTPVISLSVTSSIDFGNQQINTESGVRSYIVTGSNLISDLLVVAPVGFQISQSAGNGFSNFVTLISNNGEVYSTIYVKFIPTSLTNYNDRISHSSSGAITQYLSVIGAGINPPPSCFTFAGTVNPVNSGNVVVNIPANCNGGYTYNTQIELTASANNGYTFTGWGGDVTGSTNPITVTMNGNKNITANFTLIPVTQYTLIVTATNGTVIKNPDQSSYNSGTVVTLTATANTGYTFTGWSGDVTGSTNPITITMNGNKNVIANYSINTYSLTVTSVNGTVTKNPDQSSYNFGTVVTLTATPNTGYIFTGWSGDVTGSTNPITITMNVNKNVTANFLQKVDPSLVVIPSVQNVVSTAGNINFTVNSNVEWSIASVSDGWLTATKQNDNKINVSFQTNPSQENLRTASIVVSGKGVVAQTVSVIQHGKNVTIVEDFNNSIDWNRKLFKGTGLIGNNIFQSHSVLNFYWEIQSRFYLTKMITSTIPRGSNLKAKWFYEKWASPNSSADNSQGGKLLFLKSVPTNETNTASETIYQIMSTDNFPLITWNEKEFPINIDIPAGSFIAINGEENQFYNRLRWDYIIISSKNTTDIKEGDNKYSRQEFVLLQNYPNPFNPTTTIIYQINSNEHVLLKIFDVLGKEVALLVDQEKFPGTYHVTFNGSELPSGIYFCRLTVGDYTETKNLILQK